jgi:hypothetical protein
VDASTEDVSPAGIQDMSGNGTEFTRNLTKENLTVPVAETAKADALVIRRGKSFTAQQPLSYSDLE